MTCIREVLGSNLIGDSGYPEVFSRLSSVLPGKYEDNTLNYAITDSFHILSSSLFTTSQSFDESI
jgi:hypothetical protein